MKGLINSFLSKICLDNVLEDSYYFDENLVFKYYLSKNYKSTSVGRGGLVKKDVLKKFDIHQDVYFCEFDINLLNKIPANRKTFKELLKYPKVFRDCAFIVDKQTQYSKIIETIYKGSSKLLKEVKLFDIFESDTFGINKKSMAFSLEYYDETGTLKDEVIDKQLLKMIEYVKKELNAEFRGV